MSPALQAALAQVVPSYMQAVYGERERQVVMAVLEALTGVLRSCGTLTLQPPGRLAELCNVLKAVLQRKVSGQVGFKMGRWPGPDGDHQKLQIQLSHAPTLWKGKGAGEPRLSCATSFADSLSGH